MKRIVETSGPSGLESLLGEQVLLICGNYFYAGKLTGVNRSEVALSDASIVYETGEWKNKTWSNAELLGPGETFVRKQWIEAYRRGK